MNKKFYITGVLGIVVILGLILFYNQSDNIQTIPDEPKITIINYSQENYSLIITKNNMDKTFNVSERLRISDSASDNSYMDIESLLTDTRCDLQKATYLNQTWLNNFNNSFIETWQSYGEARELQDGNYVGVPSGNIFDGYNITTASFYLVDWETGEVIKSCGTGGI